MKGRAKRKSTPNPRYAQTELPERLTKKGRGAGDEAVVRPQARVAPQAEDALQGVASDAPIDEGSSRAGHEVYRCIQPVATSTLPKKRNQQRKNHDGSSRASSSPIDESDADPELGCSREGSESGGHRAGAGAIVVSRVHKEECESHSVDPIEDGRARLSANKVRPTTLPKHPAGVSGRTLCGQSGLGVLTAFRDSGRVSLARPGHIKMAPLNGDKSSGRKSGSQASGGGSGMVDVQRLGSDDTVPIRTKLAEVLSDDDDDDEDVMEASLGSSHGAPSGFGVRAEALLNKDVRSRPPFGNDNIGLRAPSNSLSDMGRDVTVTPKTKRLNDLKHKVSSLEKNNQGLQKIAIRIGDEHEALKVEFQAAKDLINAQKEELEVLRGRVKGNETRSGASRKPVGTTYKQFRTELVQEAQRDVTDVSKRVKIVDELEKELASIVNLAASCLQRSKGQANGILGIQVDILEHAWYPSPIRVDASKGFGTVRDNRVRQDGGIDEGTLVFENPMWVAQRPLTGGGMYSIPELVDSGGVSHANGVEAFLRNFFLRVGQAPQTSPTQGSNPHVDGGRTPRSPAVGSTTPAEYNIEDIAQSLSQEPVLASFFRDKLTRRSSEVKRSLVRRFIRHAIPHYWQNSAQLLDRDDGDIENSGFNPEIVRRVIDRAVAKVLGGGTFDQQLATVGTEAAPSSYDAWKRSREAIASSISQEQDAVVPVFGSWRRLSCDKMKALLRNAVERDCETLGYHTMHDACRDGGSPGTSGKPEVPASVKREIEKALRVGRDNWDSREVPKELNYHPDSSDDESGARDSSEERGDILFRNSHASRALASFMGRPLVRGVLKGKTSVISVARADAWFATHYSLLTSDLGGDELDDTSITKQVSGGLRNTRHNDLFKTLLPHAVSSLLNELRDAMLECDPTTVIELEKPFDPVVVVDKVSEITNRPERGDSTKQLSAEEWEELREFLDSVSKIKYSEHGGDRHYSGFRNATTTFELRIEWLRANNIFGNSDLELDDSSAMEYLALLPEFVEKKICPWLGDVCDAYIGEARVNEKEYKRIQLT